MSKKCVRFLSTASLEQEEWKLQNHSSNNSALLRPQLDQSFSHFLVKFDSKTKEIEAGVGLREEHLPAANEKNIRVLRLGAPFGDLSALNLSILFARLIRRSWQIWRKNGFRPLYWWTAADHDTYGLIARFSMRFYPSRKHLMLSNISWLQERIGRKYFGDSYHSYTGTIAERQPPLFQGELNEGSFEHKSAWLESISQAHWDNPDYGYYLDINSGVVKGNTLLVLMPFSAMNFLVMSFKITLILIKEKTLHKSQVLRLSLTNFLSRSWRNYSPAGRRVLREE